MGFDLYGQNPKLKGEEPNINWDKKPSEEEITDPCLFLLYY